MKMNANDLEGISFFTTDGTDIWKMLYFCHQPTCKLVNVETGEEESFGMGGLTAEIFHRIKMPEAAVKNG